MKHKVVCGITTKDEDWIIEKTINAVNEFCDSIIVYDDGSTDKTEEICKSFDKVIWKVRPPHNPFQREEAKQRFELIELLKLEQPDYVLLLDADEIPTPSIIPFIENMDESVTSWRIRMVNLYGSEDTYRCDAFTGRGGKVDHNPFGKEFWGKYPLFKFNYNKNYTYNLSAQKGACSLHHPAPKNLDGKLSQTDGFYLIHYNFLSEFYLSGKKHEFYAKIEEFWRKTPFEARLKHHQSSIGLEHLKLSPTKKEWFWDNK